MRLRIPLVRAARVDSTMAVARRAVEAGEAGPGAVFLADEQTAGRGRHGREWVSPSGRGLYLTAVLPGELGAPAVTLVAALAVAEAVESRCGVPARVKWPNDLLTDGRKWGGVLAEGLAGPTGDLVLLGIGLNVGHREEDLAGLEDATSLSLVTGSPLVLADLLREVLACLEARLEQFRAGGFAALAEAWRGRSAFGAGDLLEVEEGGARRVLTCAGFDEEGRLLVREEGRALSSAAVLRVRPGAPATALS